MFALEIFKYIMDKSKTFFRLNKYKKTMNNQKDSQDFLKTNSNETIMSDNFEFNFKAFSGFATKKTEKLVTALYMVTDCMESGDALKGKLRELGVDLISEVHTLVLSRTAEKHLSASHLVTTISQIISLTNIASTIGFVSDMNARILQKEFTILSNEIGKFKEHNSPSGSSNKEGAIIPQDGFTIDGGALEVALPVYKEKTLLPSHFWQDNSKGQVKESIRPIQTYGQNRVEQRVNDIISQVTSKTFFDNKEDRKSKILILIKDKKNITNGQIGVSIKDISGAFSDCSEKTIQRELNDLVSKGKIKKVGEKRWSRYHSL